MDKVNVKDFKEATVSKSIDIEEAPSEVNEQALDFNCAPTQSSALTQSDHCVKIINEMGEPEAFVPDPRTHILPNPFATDMEAEYYLNEFAEELARRNCALKMESTMYRKVLVRYDHLEDSFPTLDQLRNEWFRDRHTDEVLNSDENISDPSNITSQLQHKLHIGSL